MSFVYPRSYIGIIGGGQGNWQLAQAAHKMGFSVNLLVPDANDLATKEADQVIIGASTDVLRLRQLAAASEVVLFQDEKININSLNEAQISAKLPQGTELLAMTQDRYLEKTFLEDHNINIPPYAMVVSLSDIRAAVDSIGFPCVLKPIQKGIGQAHYVLQTAADVEQLAGELSDGSYILESWVPVSKEYAIMVSKDRRQRIQTFPVLETAAHNGRFHSALAHQKNAPALVQEIERVATQIAEDIDFQGLFGVTFFATEAGILFVDRIYPGPYQAADLYGSVTNFSQYELQLRCLCEWPLPELYLRQEGALISLPASQEPQVFGQIQKRVNWQFLFWPVIVGTAANATIGEATIVANDYESLLELIEHTDLW
ncbi:ATP-grasp domain-containing protein [Lapidilactobacillus luobeiensis]|uniref:ATP-grasp domain-containing protein n=1 Tax=Lapidilactobacillus luobeiensis TaxID=2950371 RepID=UPI0021C304DB|nr:ATP-grasp domain-containing protein [Lapidilactobacillus luobeiensis]